MGPSPGISFSSTVAAGRRTVRKGSAFPQTFLTFWEAEPPIRRDIITESPRLTALCGGKPQIKRRCNIFCRMKKPSSGYEEGFGFNALIQTKVLLLVVQRWLPPVVGGGRSSHY